MDRQLDSLKKSMGEGKAIPMPSQANLITEPLLRCLKAGGGSLYMINSQTLSLKQRAFLYK